MLLASEVLKMMNESPRIEATKKQIERMEKKIKDHALKGYRSCIADFYYYNKDFSGYNLETEIKETILCIIATKRIKYLGIKLPKEAKDLYTENCKILMKDIKDNTNR